MVEMGVQYRDGIQFTDTCLFECVVDTFRVRLDQTKKLGDADPGKVAIG